MVQCTPSVVRTRCAERPAAILRKKRRAPPAQPMTIAGLNFQSETKSPFGGAEGARESGDSLQNLGSRDTSGAEAEIVVALKAFLHD